MTPRPNHVTTAVVLYETTYCGYCRMAKRLLDSRGIPYAHFDVTRDPEMRRWLVDATGQRTVPQIFIHGEPIGGFDELAALDRGGHLLERVTPAASG